MADRIVIDQQGVAGLQKILAELTPSIQRKHARQGVAAVGREKIKIQKAHIQRSTRTTHSGRTLYSKEYAAKYGQAQATWKTIRQRPSSQWPSRAELARRGIIGTAVGPASPLAHLLEFGHRKVVWGKATGGRVRGSGFMRKAFDEVKGRADQIIGDRIWNGITKDIARNRAKQRV